MTQVILRSEFQAAHLSSQPRRCTSARALQSASEWAAVSGYWAYYDSDWEKLSFRIECY